MRNSSGDSKTSKKLHCVRVLHCNNNPDNNHPIQRMQGNLPRIRRSEARYLSAEQGHDHKCTTESRFHRKLEPLPFQQNGSLGFHGYWHGVKRWHSKPTLMSWVLVFCILTGVEVRFELNRCDRFVESDLFDALLYHLKLDDMYYAF